MENKKQLIIIPPMSEALKKLHEVLEGISGDENVEITLIDDLKELSQFLATTGQCLILVSNAKKCATFLQENRFVLAKHHAKTILFTPKEIPVKTLVKFTKIGLTESILENSPPKTFLYKVKLLLRSIKTAKVQEDVEKQVKSLENGKIQTEEEKAIKEKITAEDVSIETEQVSAKKKNSEEGEVLDYGSNRLKGKIKPQEENLDTHWKSDRKKESGYSEEAENETTSIDSEQDNIDMYYRGKKKKNENSLEIEDSMELEKLMLEAQLAEEKKRKSNYVDLIDDGTMKEKRLDSPTFEEVEEEARKKLIELELAAAEKAKSKYQEAEDGLMLTKKKKGDLLEIEEPEIKSEAESNDLGGYLKGKVKEELLLEPGDSEKKKKEYDNSEIEEDDREKDFELDLAAAEKKKKKKDNIEPDDEDNVHDGEVDHIEGNMVGDSATVDKIRTMMEGIVDNSKDPENIEDAEDYFKKRKKGANSEDEENSSKDTDLQLTPAELEAREKEKELLSDDDELNLRNKSKSDPLLEADKDPRTKEQKLDEEAKSREASTNLEKLKAEKELDKKAREEDEEMDLRTKAVNLNLEKEKKDRAHNGKVDKIDTYYRSGDSAKKKEHSWDNLLDKDDTIDPVTGKPKRNEMSELAKNRPDYGETTIDYRKLKEEFDQISREGIAGEKGSIKSVGNNTLRNDDDDGSFKVVEIDPKSLDFSINIISSIYQPDIKAKQIFAMLTDELMSTYHCYPVFYTYKLSDKKFTETFNVFSEIKNESVPLDKKEWWDEYKKDDGKFLNFQSKSMTTWRCPEIIKNGVEWEDVELPSWAEQELSTKKVELIFPYFDGIDRMGMAVVFFPDGLNPKTANGLLTVLEMARSLYLDTVQRYQVQPVRAETAKEEMLPPAEEKKNVLSIFGGLFGKKKTG